MTISSKRPDPVAFQEAVTNLVRYWIDDEDGADCFSPFSEHWEHSGPCRAVLEAEDLDHAAKALQAWFTDQMARAARGEAPLEKLARDLVGAALAAVDWHDLAEEIRE